MTPATRPAPHPATSSASPWSGLWSERQRARAGEVEGTVADVVAARLAAGEGDWRQLSYRGQDFSLGELEAAADALAGHLARAGLAPGERLAVYLQNSPEFVIAVLAAHRAGLVVVPLNPMYRAVELEHILVDSGARAVILLDELAPHLDPLLERTAVEILIGVAGPESAGAAPVGLRFADLAAATSGELEGVRTGIPSPPSPRPEDAAFLCYTSGTTGPSKGAVLTHRNVLVASRLYQAFQDLGPGDVNLAIAPLFHVTGLLAGITTSLISGTRLVLDYRFDAARMLALIPEHGVTFTVGATTVFRSLLAHPDFDADRLRSLRKVICGGAPIPLVFAEEFERRFGVRLCNGYGLTEASGPAFGTPPQHISPVHPISGVLALGIPAPFTECRLLADDGTEVEPGEPGEIVVRGAQVTPGYWGKPEETALALVDGWLRTGDIATRDEQGWFYLVDRKKDQINASGFKVWPQEVEEALVSHPAVAEAAVLGVAHPYRGETVVAAVVLAGEVSDEELRSHCRERLAAYKCPSEFRRLEALPKSDAGKVLKRTLREEFAS